jgi:hypothetical protein
MQAAVLNHVLPFVADHLEMGIAAFAALLITALAANLRQQVRRATKWALGPITRRLPWNHKTESIEPPLAIDQENELVSQFTVVNVFLKSIDGRIASYQKTSSYIVNSDELNAYREGVTAAGQASGFSSLRGTIVATVKEHGFYISSIDLGDILRKGAHFTNVYAADLRDSFMKEQEHWTQEVAFPTKHLTIQVYFPKGRPPKLVKCKVVEGTVDKQIKTNAKIVNAFGQQCIIWELDGPRLNEIYKLEWFW